MYYLVKFPSGNVYVLQNEDTYLPIEVNTYGKVIVVVKSSGDHLLTARIGYERQIQRQYILVQSLNLEDILVQATIEAL